MAREISRRFDTQAAAVVVTIEDELGARSVHTIYALRPDGSEQDVPSAISAALSDAAARAKKVKTAFQKAGWRR